MNKFAKATLTAAGLTGSVITTALGYDATKEQVHQEFTQCAQDSIVRIMEPNRYTLGKHDIHIQSISKNGITRDFDLSQGGNIVHFAQTRAAAAELCQTGHTNKLTQRIDKPAEPGA